MTQLFCFSIALLWIFLRWNSVLSYNITYKQYLRDWVRLLIICLGFGPIGNRSFCLFSDKASHGGKSLTLWLYKEWQNHPYWKTNKQWIRTPQHLYSIDLWIVTCEFSQLGSLRWWGGRKQRHTRAKYNFWISTLRTQPRLNFPSSHLFSLISFKLNCQQVKALRC